jgi:hypothetical protein
MLRIKRSVRDKYSTQSSFNLPPDADTTTAAAPSDPMAQLQKDVQFVRGNLYLHLKLFRLFHDNMACENTIVFFTIAIPVST